jgi:hypothetical protein
MNDKQAASNFLITVVMILLMMLVIMSISNAADEAKPPIDITTMTADETAKIASDMLDYGMWREQQDRDTFPKDMPKAGEPYDWETGNALHKLGPISPLPKSDSEALPARPAVAAGEVKTLPAPPASVQVAPTSEAAEPPERVNRSCLTKQQARHRWPEAYLTWRGDHCWVKGRNS